MTTPPHAIAVTSAQIRQMFNQGRYYQRLLGGELYEDIKRDSHPSAPAAHEPQCTRSQLVIYRDTATGEKVAHVHQYRRIDGSLGASGRPDPKRLLFNGVVYYVP
jgi:hypothetical protein